MMRGLTVRTGPSQWKPRSRRMKSQSTPVTSPRATATSRKSSSCTDRGRAAGVSGQPREEQSGYNSDFVNNLFVFGGSGHNSNPLGPM
ncbi:hypothetical protein U9M48_001967 [Paspalum notatum var. saurae]|uniref:Uncharacterized protein n=1 Tax=Paspalum notatum var. saurae TaxID=547442 RepID=A0AAQ3PFG2_PASNO